MQNIQFPHALVLLLSIMIAPLIMTWVIPAGEVQSSVNELGHTVVQPGTYSVLSDQTMLSPLTLFTVIPQAMADAQAVIFFVLLIGGVMGILRATGMLDAIIGVLLKRFAN